LRYVGELSKESASSLLCFDTAWEMIWDHVRSGSSRF
jgi:hypothetical protein